MTRRIEAQERRGSGLRSYAEGRLRSGLVVHFEAQAQDVEDARAALDLIHAIHFPQNHTVRNIEHGGYGRYTRYDVVQHEYAGGPGYVEVLEIKDAPDGRRPVVVHEYQSGRGNSFTEFETVEDAKGAFERFLTPWNNEERIKGSKGLIRQVECGELTPWFWAVGNEELIGDYTVPFGLSDDPVYRLGTKFVITDEEGRRTIRTCMGTRYYDVESSYSWGDGGKRDRKRYRVIYFHDGSTFDEYDLKGREVRRFQEGEAFIAEALMQFELALSGQITNFSIDLADGTTFIGRIKRKEKGMSVEGKYFVKIEWADGKGQEGYVDFSPTKENPTVERWINSAAERVGRTINRIDITSERTLPNGKKWSGVFYRTGGK